VKWYILFDSELAKLKPLINNKNILITGNTGSFGNKMTENFLKHFQPNKIIILSRDEFKQSMVKKKSNTPNMRCFIGDIRDYDGLDYAFHGANIIFHTAALEQVDQQWNIIHQKQLKLTYTGRRMLCEQPQEMVSRWLYVLVLINVLIR
jgi:dTDP-D-glucose 4,6-dehydratase